MWLNTFFFVLASPDGKVIIKIHTKVIYGLKINDIGTFYRTFR